MKLFRPLLIMIMTFITTTAYALPVCGVVTPPRLVFILDDSGSIDDTERGLMTVAIQKIVDGVRVAYPDAEFGAVQYVQETTSTPQDGNYDIIAPYTKNLTIAITKNPIVADLGQDHLPDSLNKMITDGIFSPGGVLEKPDGFFIYTDASRTSEICCTNLENSGTMTSTDAAPGFGEYTKLAQLSNTGNISLYHSLPTPADSTPEIAQGTGIYRNGATFDVPQADIDAITSNIIQGIGDNFTGDVTEAALPVSTHLKTNDQLFIPSKSLSPLEGHLKSYKIDDKGQPAASETWDAATKMTAAKRVANLYSTDASGNKVLFDSLDDAAFGSTGALNVATIKNYTIDPSFSSGAYLGDRQNGSFLGGVSEGNSLDLLTNEINRSLYLTDSSYRGFYKNTVASRQPLVLMSSDDGFLYAFNQITGELVWGWMPRSLASQLVNPNSFQDRHLMAGSVDILDIKDSTGAYASYVIASYKQGLGHYVLKLDDNGDLDQIVWDEDTAGVASVSPNDGEIEFFRDESGGKVYSIYSYSTSAATSRLKIRSLTDISVNKSIDLPYSVTSTPFVMQNYEKQNAPKKKHLYLGTSTGSIHSAGLLNASGSLDSDLNIQSQLQASSVATMSDTSTDPVTYIDASISAEDNRYYLSTQTEKRLTIHRYNSSNASWHKLWTSFVSGAGQWDDAGNYATDISGVPSKKDGFAIIPPDGIQSLPSDATITDKAFIVADAVVLPLSVPDSTSTNCVDTAYYYMYNLFNGKFPKETFLTVKEKPILTNIVLGYGDGKRLNVSDFLGTDKLLAYGLADQNLDFKAGIASSFTINDPVTTGIRGWREVGH